MMIFTFGKGTEIDISATHTPVNQPLNWSDHNGNNLIFPPEGFSTLPEENTVYYASVDNMGCTATDSIFIQVDSLPWQLDIFPGDTTICSGEIVFLTTQPLFDPDEFSGFRRTMVTNGRHAHP